MAATKLRLSPSGPEIRGDSDQDVLIWDASTQTWSPGPQSGGGVLAGDANGAIGANQVNFISPSIGGLNIPLGDFTSDPIEIRFVVRLAANGDVATVSQADAEAVLELTGDANGALDTNEVNSLSPVTGGANLTLDDFTSDPVDPRVVVRAPAGGPITTVTLGAIGLEQAFDFIITDRASLVAVVAPIGNVFDLPTGSYAFKQALTLNAGERIRVPNGSSVLCMGMGPSKVLSSSALGTDPLWEIEAGAVANINYLSLLYPAGDTGPCLLSSSDDTRLTGCRIDGNTTADAALRVSAGDCYAVQCDIVGASGATEMGFEMDGVARARLSNCDITSLGGGLFAIHMTGTSIAQELYCSNCRITGDTGTTIAVRSDDADVWLDNCEINSLTDGVTIVACGPASSLSIRGGEIRNTAGGTGDGVVFNNGTTVGVDISGVFFHTLDEAIRQTGATQNRVTISNNDFFSCNIALDWATIPADGLLIHGNRFNGSTPFQGFTPATADVNAKCNSQNAGLTTETAIVP